MQWITRIVFFWLMTLPLFGEAFHSEQKYDAEVLTSHLFAVHATSYLPTNGSLEAGRGNALSTIHFSLGELVQPNNRTWDECPFALVTPLSSLMPQLVNLNCYDTFIAGDLPLTEAMTLLVPTTHDKALPTNVAVVRYDSETTPLRQAVDQVITDQGGWSIRMVSSEHENHFLPAMIGITDVNTPDFFAPLLGQYPSLSVGLRFDPHHGEAYKLGQLDLAISELIESYLGDPNDPCPEQIALWRSHIEQALPCLQTHLQTLPKTAQHSLLRATRIASAWLQVIDANP